MRRRRAGVRTPPRPPYEGVPRRCNMCGTPPVGRRETWCSDECVKLWFVATNSSTALPDLVALHGWSCWSCGRPADHLQVDHRVPLWSLNEDQRTELRWWLPFNLQLLCGACHAAKTAAEAAQRALARRTGLVAAAGYQPAPTLPGF